MKAATLPAAIIAVLIFLAPAGGEAFACTAKAFAHISKHQEEENQEDYPEIVRPAGVLPSGDIKIPKGIKKIALEGTIEFVEIDIKPLKLKETEKIRIWVGGDIGYIIAKKESFTYSNVLGVYGWLGRPIKGGGFATVTFDQDNDNEVRVSVIYGVRGFVIKKLKGTNLFVLYEIDDKARPRESPDDIINVYRPKTKPKEKKKQEEESIQEDYPEIVRPAGVLPSGDIKIPKGIKKIALEGTIEFVEIDIKPLKLKETEKIRIWVGGDIGYIIAKKESFTYSNVLGTYAWSGRPIKGGGFATFAFDKDNEEQMYIHVSLGIRGFAFKKIKGTNLGSS